MRRRGGILSGLVAMAMVAVSCASGPSTAALERDRKIATTTTTEAPPPDTAVIKIVNGAFAPAILEIDLDVTPIVEWRHEDTGNTAVSDPIYIIATTSGDFQSEELSFGDTFSVNFGELPPDIYRYFALIGFNRLPGTIDTRPNQ